MASQQADIFSAPTNLRIFAYFSSVFTEDWAFLRIVFLGVSAWFFLALLSAYFIPDTTTNTVQNSTQYLDFVVRNGQFYLTFVLALIPIKILRASKNTDRGQSVFPIFKTQFKIWLAGPKKEAFGIPAYFIMAMAVFAVYLFSFSTIKTRIPDMVPYMWDDLFMRMDRAIFLGKDPWQYFALLYEYPKIILVMDFIYDFWAVLLVSTWFFSLRYGGQNKTQRFQFVLALLLTWFIGGNILAIFMSSGGPVYYEALTGLPSSYSDQMALLSTINTQTPLRAFEYQQLLWQIYESPSVGLGGISAMPSMHCASSFLLFLMFGKTAFTRLVLGGFFLLIFVSSFVLAWHYAVDGLFVLPITYGCWRLAGWILKKSS
jgi:PAP2 superfamily